VSNTWSDWTDPETVARRAGGRRHYNAMRRFRATFRRFEVARLLRQGLRQVDIARRLGVHRSTICRDVAALYEMARQWGDCPVCGSEVRLDLLRLDLR